MHCITFQVSIALLLHATPGFRIGQSFIHPFPLVDPQAKALQEEFLRLQQQFLSWQSQAAVHPSSTAMADPSVTETQREEPIPKDDSVQAEVKSTMNADENTDQLVQLRASSPIDKQELT